MLKNDVAVVGAGLGGATVAYGLQQKNYRAYLINGSEQDNRTIPDAKNVLILEGYDGLAGDRSLALEALQRNKQILKTISEIEQKIVLCVASGGGSTGSGNLPYICDILAANSERIVVPIVLMPRKDEPIQKRLNAYNLAKELMDTDGIGAIIFVNNESYDDLKRINVVLVNMRHTLICYRTNGILVTIGSANILISMIRSLYVKQLKSNVFAKKES